MGRALELLQECSEATGPRLIRAQHRAAVVGHRCGVVTPGSVTFAGISGHDVGIAPVTFVGMPVTIPESLVTFVRNTQLSQAADAQQGLGRCDDGDALEDLEREQVVVA